MSVSKFNVFASGWSATVTATSEENAREQIISELGGDNTPEYVSEDQSTIAVADTIYNVSAQNLHKDVYSCQIQTAE